MRRVGSLVLLAIPLLSVTTAFAAEERAPALVLLVRHAEKAAAPAADPPLTEAGVARARALSAALRDAGVTAIITTPWRRTRETAEPLASALGLVPEVVPVEPGGIAAHVEATVAAVRRRVRGVVLVVGHSNTVPAIVAALGGPSLPDICDPVHGSLFTLVPDGAGARLVRSHYGAAEPDPGPGCQ